MSDHTSAPSLEDLRGITDHVRFILDAKACAKRADELIGLTIAAQETQAAAEMAQGNLAGMKAEHDAACAEREVRANELVALGASRQAEADRKEARLGRIAKDIREQDARLRREVMRFANLLPGFSEKLQSLPSWTALAGEVLGGRVDADDIDGDQHSGKDADEAATTALPVEPENLIAGSSLMQRGGHRNGAGRRASR
jgi:hypothetical protein